MASCVLCPILNVEKRVTVWRGLLMYHSGKYTDCISTILAVVAAAPTTATSSY